MLLHPSFAVNDAGHLTIGSLDAVELSKTFGTPTYYLDLDAVRAQCRMYRAAFAAHFGVNAFPVFAGKSLCFRKLYRVMAEEQMCADCVSPGELYTAHTAGFPMERVFFHGNNKTDADLRYAVELGVGHIVVDGPDELYALETIAAERQRQVSILLRITPGIDPHTHRKILTGNVDSKFGMAILTGQALSFVREALSMTHLTVEGFHCHIGSQIFTAAPFVDAAEIMLAFLRKVYDKTGYMASVLNLGGGFGVRYVAEDPVFEAADCIRQLGEEIRTMCRTLSIPQPTIYMEPGRSIVAAAGATVYTVGSVKEIPGFRNYVSVDGGMPDNPRYTLYASRYMVVHANRANAPADFCCTLAGRCCESGDLLAEDTYIAKPKRGELLAVLVTGAYNYSMASNYNRIPRPPVVTIENARATVAVARESLADLVRLDMD